MRQTKYAERVAWLNRKCLFKGNEAFVCWVSLSKDLIAIGYEPNSIGPWKFVRGSEVTFSREVFNEILP